MTVLRGFRIWCPGTGIIVAACHSLLGRVHSMSTQWTPLYPARDGCRGADGRTRWLTTRFALFLPNSFNSCISNPWMHTGEDALCRIHFRWSEQS